MIEADKGMVDFAIQELHTKRIEIRCNAENGQSRRVAE
ncbi:GNAT family N-acetyltransferase [Pseudalkalibacillus hwajinpoensis]